MAGMALGVLASCTMPERGQVETIPPEGAQLEATVYVSARGPDQADAQFDIPWLDAKETRVSIASIEQGPMSAALECDGEARLRAPGEIGAGAFMRPGALKRFTLPSRYDGQTPTLVLPNETERCVLSWGDDNRLLLVRENIGDPEVARLDAQPVGCSPAAVAGDPLARAFFEERSLSQTCPRPTGSYALYADETEALRLRLEKLTGSPVTRAAVAKGDPDMPLDFTNAPYYDEIVVSYLQVRADISGYLMARALAFHAARGTKVRIAVSGSLALPKDERLFRSLAAQYPNVQLQYFKYAPQGVAPGEKLTAFFTRSHHVKIFAAYSQEPGHSFALVGGRNLHDGFFYPDLEDRNPGLPFLINYDVGSLNPLNYIDYYEDFEIGLFDQQVVAGLVAQFGQFWNRDARGALMAETIDDARGTDTVTGRDGLVRHFLSTPWSDGISQEALYVDLIDAARHDITAISPFLYPTPAIDAGLVRAADRGVHVRLVTRLLSDEPLAFVVAGPSSEYFDRRKDLFDFYHYEPEGGVAHTKLIAIDDRVAVVASTNLNRRSFFGDSENGFVFLDRQVARDIRAEVENAIRAASPATATPGFIRLGKAILAIPALINQF